MRKEEKRFVKEKKNVRERCTLNLSRAQTVWDASSASLIVVPLRLGSNPGEAMDVCKCIVPSQHGGTLNSHRAASPLVRLVGGPWSPPGCSSKLGWKGAKSFCHLYGAQSYGAQSYG
ncbi:hypothetical protein TNCV_3509321 [Trichonephila clavipes]|nr:hypothetical protein TNCV_3509321 [Trichonephila clavipes]